MRDVLKYFGNRKLHISNQWCTKRLYERQLYYEKIFLYIKKIMSQRIKIKIYGN